MIYFVAFLAALLGGALSGLGMGFGVAEIFTRFSGNRDGGAGMAGLFIFGPFGLVVGFLITFGLVLRYGGGSTDLANWTLIGGTAVFAFASLLVMLEVSTQIRRVRGPKVPQYEVTLEFEVPSGVEPSDVHWAYAGEGRDVPQFSEFYVHRDQPDGTMVVSRVLNVPDSPPHRSVLVALGPGRDTPVLFDFPFAEKPAEFNEWRSGAGESGIRFRCMMRPIR